MSTAEMRHEAPDRTAIVEVLSRYAFALDLRNFESLAECFTADARAEYSGVVLEPGLDHIIEHVRGLARLPATQHIIGSVSIHVEGFEASAVSHAVAHLVRPTGDGHEVIHRGLTYHDEFTKTKAGWRIHHRVHQVHWMTVEPTVWPVPAM